MPIPEMGDGIEGIATVFNRYYAPVFTSDLIRDSRRILLVRYEDLVTNAASTVARLSLWSGLDIEPEAVANGDGGDDGSIFGASLYGKKISRDAIGNFRTRLDAADIAVVEKVTSQFIETFGYGLSLPT